ncbi:MAG: HD domain-containing protein, partial [Acidobacteria bacterium]|nr:HD domain-containing protein [Acidobacteriota bacterium]
HRYTVDEHTLIAFEALSRLGDHPDPSRRRFAELLTEIDQPALLLFAMLLHDIGKGGGEGRHVEEGLALAEQAMERIQVPEEQRDAVRFLIGRHLELSNVMTSRALDDPATVRMLAERVETLESLKRLTLLTYADISAVNPEAMTPWRLQQLWHAYLAGYRELTRELETDRIEPPEAPAVPHGEFVLGFPKRYLRTHSVREIEKHVQLSEFAGSSGVAVDVTRTNGVYQAIVIAADRPGVFASLAGALASFGMNIVKAEAFSNRSGQILDTFSFADPSRTLELNPTEVDRLRITLERVAQGRADTRKLLESRPRPTLPSRRAGVEPTVSFDVQAAAGATLIEIVAQDRPGLLYDLASSISSAGCNIEVVLIDTQSHKALDVFYVTKGGHKLDHDAQDDLHARLLKACQG